MTEKTKAYFMVIAYALITGLSFLAVKVSLGYASVFNQLAHRFTVALALLVILHLFGVARMSVTKEDFIGILPLTLFFPILFFSLQAYALVFISSAETGIFQATAPIFTVILAWVFLRESTTSFQKIFLLLTVAGTVYTIIGGGVVAFNMNIIGVAAAILSTVSVSFYSVLGRSTTRKHNACDITWMIVVVGFVCFNAIALAEAAVKGSLANYFVPFKSPVFVLAILFLGPLSSALTSYLTMRALMYIEASEVSVFMNLGTVVAMVAGTVFLHERLMAHQITGAAMILIGVAGVSLCGRKKTKS